jgi:hypothetical protein
VTDLERRLGYAIAELHATRALANGDDYARARFASSSRAGNSASGQISRAGPSSYFTGRLGLRHAATLIAITTATSTNISNQNNAVRLGPQLALSAQKARSTKKTKATTGAASVARTAPTRLPVNKPSLFFRQSLWSA